MFWRFCFGVCNLTLSVAKELWAKGWRHWKPECRPWSLAERSGPTILWVVLQYFALSEWRQFFLCNMLLSLNIYIYIYTYPLHVCTWCYDSRGSLQSNHCSRSNLSFAKKYQTTFAVRIHWIENLSEFHVLSNMHDDILYKTAIVWTLPH